MVQSVHVHVIGAHLNRAVDVRVINVPGDDVLGAVARVVIHVIDRHMPGAREVIRVVVRYAISVRGIDVLGIGVQGAGARVAFHVLVRRFLNVRGDIGRIHEVVVLVINIHRGVRLIQLMLIAVRDIHDQCTRLP